MLYLGLLFVLLLFTVTIFHLGPGPVSFVTIDQPADDSVI